MSHAHSASQKAPTFRLWLMMVLEFAIWGAWLPLIWGYMGAGVADGGLGFTGPQIAWVGSAFAIASIVGEGIGGLSQGVLRALGVFG